jgi:hypothetical protein
MTELTVVDAGYDDIAGKIASGIRGYGGDPSAVRIVKAASSEARIASQPDILVLTEDAPRVVRQAGERVKCGILLLPGDSAASGTDAEAFDAGCIVTYGMSPKNTITLSSISEESCVLAIQREFLTSSGELLERQEMRIKGGMRPGSLLAVAGALLILGLRLSDANP